MRRKYYLLLSGLTVLYVALVFAGPVDHAVLDKYHLSVLSLRLLDVAILLPLIAVWYISFYGFITIKSYASVIKHDDDGQGFEKLGHGLAILGIGMVLSSIATSVIKNLTLHDRQLIPTGVIIGNYLAVGLAMASFWYMYQGSLTLTGVIPGHNVSDRWPLLRPLYTMFGAVFAYSAATNSERRAPAMALTHGLYYLPDWLIVVSVILPLLVAWYLGLLAVRNIAHYSRNINGVIYRSQLKRVAQGLTIIITSSVGVQILTLFSKSTSNLSLGSLLLIIFALIAVIAVGFIVVAIGAKKLMQLEGL
jgi:hypothetical protein